MSNEQTNEKTARVKVVVKGKVQGVFFRAGAVERARELGLTGWVRNTEDNKVEAILEGERAQIKQMINWVKQGPSGAVVEKVEVKEQKYQGEFSNFNVKT